MTEKIIALAFYIFKSPCIRAIGRLVAPTVRKYIKTKLGLQTALLVLIVFADMLLFNVYLLDLLEYLGYFSDPELTRPPEAPSPPSAIEQSEVKPVEKPAETTTIELRKVVLFACTVVLVVVSAVGLIIIAYDK
jgi:hypothetical protein